MPMLSRSISTNTAKSPVTPDSCRDPLYERLQNRFEHADKLPPLGHLVQRSATLGL